MHLAESCIVNASSEELLLAAANLVLTESDTCRCFCSDNEKKPLQPTKKSVDKIAYKHKKKWTTLLTAELQTTYPQSLDFRNWVTGTQNGQLCKAKKSRFNPYQNTIAQ